MKIEHLYYFLMIVDAKSINKAAQQLFLSQQQLSRIVNNLENTLHVQLLTRSAHGVVPTEKGETLVKHAEKIIEDYRALQSEFYLDALPPLTTKQSPQGKCQIVFPSFFSLYLNDFLQKFNSQYPGIQATFYENMSPYQIQDIAQSQKIFFSLDITDDIKKELVALLTFYCIGDTNVKICLNRHTPLAKKSLITDQDILTIPQTAYPHWTETVLNPQNILFMSSNIYQHLESVVSNQSCCLVPAYTQPAITEKYPDIVLLPFENHLQVPMYIVHSKKHHLSNAEKTTLRFLAEYISQLNQAAANEERKNDIKFL